MRITCGGPLVLPLAASKGPGAQACTNRPRSRPWVTSWTPAKMGGGRDAHEDGTKVTLHLAPLRRNPPQRVLVHLDGWSVRTGTLELPGDQAVDRDIPLAAVLRG